ncbi:MAG: isoleucine--tRNA ligase [Candidatus Cloacimonetes bacterium HGW-Cloacimonetes-1]|jgi:isoleucyl-tRNA synthetase|nr:MAG: isoleucine--tRNA ligase [Candidatus Cloacimonetes bacterium HGW-Cloacimonetes-1]
MYNTIDLKESPSHLEARLRKHWFQNNLPQKSVDFRAGKPQFVFYEGPPTANGKPGIHHVMARTLKDVVCRYKTMNGYQVKRKAGWDTHGLPVEIEVEKMLGLEDKKGIEDYGIEPFCKKCKESVFTYEKLWREMTQIMGYWIDLDNPYITLSNDYIESVWWILNDFFERGLIYKGYKIVPYCPSCGTPLSSHEVAQGYKDVEDPSVFVRFKATDEDNLYYLAWTTTPWTLISNVALAVNPDETYVKVLYQDQHLILAKARLSILGEDFTIVEEFAGSTLEFKTYEPLFRFVEPEKKAWYIGLADYVTMTDGTGIVHTAPAFGQDDFSLAQKYDLPFIQPVDGAGKFTELVTPWAGQFVKSADKDIIRALKESGALFRREQVKHSYPHCWRCESPLIYYARESWFIRTTQFKNELIEQNKQINWYPSFVGEKRFGDWLENNVDWALSRDRFWGTPLNIWLCDDCDHKKSIGSIADLLALGKLEDGSPVPTDIELHKPYVDNVVLTCPHCSGKMHRTSEVIDCWFDSGAMPFAQWHYPFENKERFETELFPGDFISEGIDQTRGWFNSMLTISTLFMGKSSYKSCLVNDLILDKSGQKMSKTRGNSVDPLQLMQDYGADAIRWYLLEVSPPWVPTRFDIDGVKEILGKFVGTLKNVYSFYATYANIDGFDANAYPQDWHKTAEIDRWIVSRLHSLIRDVRIWTDQYDFTKSVRAIQSFVIDEVSNWYVRRSRRRFWSMQLDQDKIDAYVTLNQVLVETAKLIAPFVPYLAEELYINLTGAESVHLVDYPLADSSVIDVALEKEMQTVINIVSLGRAARNECQIKVRQPLQTMYVPAKVQPTAERMFELIQEEINIHTIEYIKDDDDFVQYELKPDFKVMGPKYGKQMKNIAGALQGLKGQDVLLAFNSVGHFDLTLGAEQFSLSPEDIVVHIRPREGVVFKTLDELFVALDTTMTPELVMEGYARELINKIQFTRKDQDFQIMDRINVSWFGDDDIAQTLATHGEYVKSETLTDSMQRADANAGMTQCDINGKEVWLWVTRL